MGSKQSKSNIQLQETYVESRVKQPRYRRNNFGDINPTERQIRNKLREEHSGIRSNNWISNSQWTRMNSK